MTEMTVIKRCNTCGYYDSNGANFCKTCGSKLMDVSDPIFKEIGVVKVCVIEICPLYYWMRQRGYSFDIFKLGSYKSGTENFELNLPKRKIANIQMPRMNQMPEDTIQARSTALRLIKILAFAAVSCYLLRYIIGDILLLILLMTVGPISLICVISTIVKEGEAQKPEIAKRLQPYSEYQSSVERVNRENAQKLAIAKEQMLIRQRELDREYINEMENWLKHLGRSFYEYTKQWKADNPEDFLYAVEQHKIKKDLDNIRSLPPRKLTPEEIQELHEDYERQQEWALKEALRHIGDFY